MKKSPAEPVAHGGATLNAGSCVESGHNPMTPQYVATNRCMIAVIVYFALLLDNVLLTVIVPILPDYLASINNGALHASLESASVAHYSAQHLAYRNLDGSLPSQVIMTKHPIPGKSMVNFSLQHLSNERPLMATALLEQKHLRQTSGGSGSGYGIATKALTTANTIGADNSIVRTMTSHAANSPSIDTASAHGTVARTNPSSSNSSSSSSTETNAESLLADENGSIGILLSMKALVQLICNPIVGNMSSKYGYRLPIVLGTFCLLLSSLVFAIGETYITLLLARAIQGVGSACIAVCGMSLVAQHYPEEDRRSKVMGIILGSMGMGVLLGYPFGGILYDLIGKSAPFIILAAIIFINLGMQLIVMDLSVHPEVIVNVDREKPQWRPLLESKMVLAIVVAIWFSTSTMAMLEPCLPIWLIQYLHPTKWQLGTVFIPDSFGYFVGTNFFATIAYQYGQVKISCISLLLVGISSILIPSATTVGQLLLPHFGLGLGIGIIDAALVPLLATFVDDTLTLDEPNDADNADNESGTTFSYGTVYAIQQTSVSLAYFLAPLIGGELAQAFGFTWLMRIVGFVNMLYGPILVWLHQKYNPKILREKHNEMLLINTGRGSQYKQLYNSVDPE